MTNIDRRVTLTQPQKLGNPGTTVKAFVIKCANLRLRMSPTTDSGVLLQLVNGEKVYVLAQEGTDWLKVRTKDGETGYAMSSYLEVC